MSTAFCCCLPVQMFYIFPAIHISWNLAQEWSEQLYLVGRFSFQNHHNLWLRDIWHLYKPCFKKTYNQADWLSCNIKWPNTFILFPRCCAALSSCLYWSMQPWTLQLPNPSSRGHSKHGICIAQTPLSQTAEIQHDFLNGLNRARKIESQNRSNTVINV